MVVVVVIDVDVNWSQVISKSWAFRKNDLGEILRTVEGNRLIAGVPSTRLLILAHTLFPFVVFGTELADGTYHS